jgi:hypothetical protein
MSTSQSKLVIDVVGENKATYYFKPTYMRADIGCIFWAEVTSITSTHEYMKPFETDSAGWAIESTTGDPIGFVSGYLTGNVITAIKNPSSYEITWFLQDTVS